MQAPPLSDKAVDHHDRIRVIGQGLVGSLLALRLDTMGFPFVVQDVSMPGTATAVAPGIVNPLAGKNFSPPDNLPWLMDKMLEVMSLAEKKLARRIWIPCPILRMYAEPSQIDRFNRSMSEEEKKEYVEEEYPENTFEGLNDVFGSFLTKGGGWANLPALVGEVRLWLEKTGRLVETEWDLNAEPESSIRELLVFCEGWQVSRNPLWSFIPHNPAKGEMLVVRFEDPLPRDRIYNQSCWAQPIEEDFWRVGATYSWSDFGSNPSLKGANTLQERLNLLTSIPFHVQDQLAGVRPIVEDYRPVIGVHPDKPDCFIVNAMGSKGVLQAPAAIDILLDHLKNGSPIPPAWNVNRFG